ncbi:MAG: beta-N-acetylhexosaminidase [Ktedonobacterales bacterium]
MMHAEGTAADVSEVDDLTEEQQVGQLFMAGFDGLEPTAEILDLIQRRAIGGVILFSRNTHDAEQVATLTRRLQEAAREAGHRYPLLIAIDQENGVVQRLVGIGTQFPGAMALGAAGSEELAYAVAEATGRELRALGINMNLAPVADVNNNPANPVIGVRSFGEDPQKVARLVAATVRGYRAAGVISVLKHFPGHGDTAVDSHLALPSVPHTMERLDAVELPPFKCGIEAGAESVMIAHVALPHLMGGDDVPATVSPEVVTGLLRRRLGFDGVILTDCLEMDAIVTTIGTERAAVLALLAGTDLVLISHTYSRQIGGIQAVQEALNRGELARETVQQAVERVLRMKAAALRWDERPFAEARAEIASEAHLRLRDEAYARAITVVRNEAGLLPMRLDAGERVLVLGLLPERVTLAVENLYAHDGLVESVRQYHANVQGITVPSRASEGELAAMWKAIDAADVVVAATLNANLDERQAERMRELVGTGKRVVGIAVGAPYDLLAFPALRTYLATYEFTSPALRTVGQALFGAVEAAGRLPVTLAGA